MTRPITHEPHATHINLLPPRRVNRYRPPVSHEPFVRHVNALVALIGVLAFCWWLGGRIHAAVMAGSKPFVDGAQRVAEMVSGR